MDRVPFSQRVGAAPAPQVGLRDMPGRLRVALWNTFENWIFNENLLPGQFPSEAARRVFTYIGWPADEAREHWVNNLNRLKEWFFETSWDRVYDFVEWLSYLVGSGKPEQFGARDQIVQFGKRYMNDLDRALEREGSPYRLSGTLWRCQC
jgi:hypothetical protein